MSWRRFVTLLAGLSPESLFVRITAAEGPTRDERVISDDADIDRFIANYGV